MVLKISARIPEASSATVQPGLESQWSLRLKSDWGCESSLKSIHEGHGLQSSWLTFLCTAASVLFPTVLALFFPSWPLEFASKELSIVLTVTHLETRMMRGFMFQFLVPPSPGRDLVFLPRVNILAYHLSSACLPYLLLLQFSTSGFDFHSRQTTESH